MEVIYHPLIRKDLREALYHYDAEGAAELGDRFFDEAEKVVARVLRNPKGFHIQEKDLRLAQFKVFPYHFRFHSPLSCASTRSAASQLRNAPTVKLKKAEQAHGGKRLARLDRERHTSIRTLITDRAGGVCLPRLMLSVV